TCGDLLVCFSFCMRGCGCIGHPVFPAPSVFEGPSSCTPRTLFASREAKSCLNDRHCEERELRSNPFFLCAARRIASLALAMTVVWSFENSIITVLMVWFMTSHQAGVGEPGDRDDYFNPALHALGRYRGVASYRGHVACLV